MEIILSGYGKYPDNTIVKYQLEDDAVTKLQWSSTIENPSFVCEGDGYLFTVTESDTYAYVYLFGKEEEGYQLLDQRKIDGGALCHITYSSKNKALFGACYATGTLFSIRVEAGKFGEILYQEIQRGVGEEDLTRAHCVLLNQDESQLVVINIALDKIYCYWLSEGSLQLAYLLEAPKGSGPRHAQFSEDESTLYVITEYSNEILIYEYKAGGKLRQRISTLPPTFQGTSNCSTLCFGQDRRYLYAANRGADTIAQYQVGKDGSLTWLGEFPCGGKHPRHMVVTNDGRYLIVCNQHSDNVAVFTLNLDSGSLSENYCNLKFRMPSGILQLSE